MSKVHKIFSGYAFELILNFIQNERDGIMYISKVYQIGDCV